MWHLREHRAPIRKLTFSPTGQHIASLDDSGKTLLWDLTGAPRPRQLFAPGDGVNPTTDLEFFPKGDRLLMCRSAIPPAALGYWNVESPDSFVPLPSGVEHDPSLALFPDGSKLFISSRVRTERTWVMGSLEVRDIPTWTQLWRGNLGSYRSRGKILVSAHASGVASTSTSDSYLVMRDSLMLHYRGTWAAHPTSVRAVQIAPDGLSLATVGPNQIRVWALPNSATPYYAVPALVVELPRIRGSFWSTLAYSRDGTRLAAGRNGGVVHLYDTETWNEWSVFRWPVGNVHTLAFAPDGFRLAVGGERGAIVVWDVE